jgi:hypothetical protein
MTEEVRKEIRMIREQLDSLPKEKEFLDRKAQLLKEREEIHLPWDWYMVKAQIEFKYDTKLFKDNKEQPSVREDISRLETLATRHQETFNILRARVTDQIASVNMELSRMMRRREELSQKIKQLSEILR